MAILVDNSAAHHAPTAEQLREWSQLREKERNEELLRLAVHKEEATSKKISEEAVRKRLEREAKRADSTNEVTKQSTVALACSGQDLSAHMIVIPTLSPNLPWFTLENHVFHTLESAIQAGIWNFPSSLQERASCGVFRALWEKGYYLGNGVKFGGEYLVYPGNCLRVVFKNTKLTFTQGIRCVITLILLQQFRAGERYPCAPWRLLLMVA